MKFSITKLINRLKFRRPPSKSPLQSLPNELVLHIFSFLELKPYIISHGVCKRWRRLLPLTDIHPIRKRLFDLYHSVLNTPNFHITRHWLLGNLQPFDRQAYIDSLLSQYPVIPEEFRFWILEWPEQMVIQCTWPGLPFTRCCDYSPTRRHGVNWIAHRPSSPTLSALVYKKNPSAPVFIPALLVWRTAVFGIDWLVFEGDNFGRVYSLSGYYHHPGALPFLQPKDEETASTQENDSNSYLDTDDENGGMQVHTDWISYQESLWLRTSREILDLGRKYVRRPDSSIPQPVEFSSTQNRPSALPSPLWESRDAVMHYLTNMGN